jgi:sugar (pentulose or hexulose) kinase
MSLQIQSISEMVFDLGFDFGTSGARAIAIDRSGTIRASAQTPLSAQTPEVWRDALFFLLEQIPIAVRSHVRAIAIDGTSSTCLACDRAGTAIAPPMLYNDRRAATILDRLRTIAPPNHLTISASSSLAKLLWACDSGYFVQNTPLYFLHQADWIAFLLHGQLAIGDYHNALKLGYDPETLCYPDWLLDAVPGTIQLPETVAPGTKIAKIRKKIGDRFRLPPDCAIVAGTTDSIAAFLASPARQPGEAVTSLGSTLVLKLLSRTRIDDARFGIYSHRFGDLWLAGGASNAGGAVLRQFFGDRQLAELSEQIDPNSASPLDYYPLLEPGERFPVNDPELAPRLTPRPESDVEFLHGLLESLARIEARGYQCLQTSGATPLARVYSAGGGAQNLTWSAIRQRCLGVEVVTSPQTEAAYGTALLAASGAGS